PRYGLGCTHKPNQTLDQVLDIAERPCLLSVAVYSHGLVAQRLNDKVAYNPAVVRMHVRPIGIKDARYLDRHAVLPMIVEEQGFGAPLSLVIARARSQRVDITPIGFRLRMHGWIPVDLAGGGLQDRSLHPLRQPQHVDRPMDTRLR